MIFQSQKSITYIQMSLKKSTGTSGVMNKSLEKSAFSVAVLLVLPAVKSSTKLTPEAGGTGWAGALLG